ncbi:hypothetical protein EDC04DRAFT_3127421 [Pisolithus marmoratus]|nr:hypothetical protein EDC04DRAFT_3127421 [Pisolithus marmoratus]
MVMQREADPDAAAKVYLQTHCFGPITQFTGSTSLSCVAVSWHGQGRKELIDLTHQKVTETFKLQPDTPSPVSMVTSMAQRMLPRLKIEGSIDVGRLRYWRTLTTGANFGNHTITECLAVIYTDIVRVWNFNDPSQYLYSGEFRGLMAQLATTIDRSTTASHRPTRADTTGLICEDGPPPVFLPFVAGLGLVQWARETYPQLPNVHHMFMAYIVDLVHVLEILFTLTASNNEKKLTRNAINSAFGIYYESEMRRSTHHEITSSDYNIPSCDTVLEKIISLVRTSPIDDNDISRALGNIPLEYLGLDTEWLSNATDYLTQIISFQRAALKRTPPGHQGRFVSLVNLSNSLHERFTKGGSFADLDEIIAVRRAALECTPPTPSDQCTSLLNLADSLRDKYARLGVDADLAEAIKHAGTALVRCPPEHHASCRDFVTSCMKLKPGHWRASPPIIDSGAEPSEVKQVVRNIVTEIVKSLPLRLLNTYTGALCDRDAQISYFEDSFQYNKLLSSTQRGLEFELSVRKTAWEFFGYTTLSHRWGTREPLLRSIQGNNIYCVDGGEGFAKLRSFCALTFKHRYMWAWSDTCCIDKDNSEELQKTIGSMFSWYRQSALTIVHLSDVSSTSPLVDSVWFKRGWTLQELLASPRVLFYTQDWSPYMNSTSSNHKTDDAILTELQKVTRIEKLQLERFSPGVDDARLKLQWASTRCTTRPEDVAYSLFGIFQVSLPVDYGETAQDAIGRLLMEIVSRSGDVSILDWVGEASSFHSCFPASLTPYQTVPQIQSAPSELSIYNDVDLEQERKLYNTVAQLRPPRFVGGRLVLPCLVHQITKVKRLKTSSTTSNHDYEIDAFGLAILRRTLSSSLQEGSEGHLPYILIRPWNPKILHPRAHGYVPGSLLEWLRQPFDALLLESRPHNEYKRIASDCLINARLEDLASVLHSGWQTLEIV